MIDQKQTKKAVEILRAGGLVAMPTETVYGLAADAKNEAAIARIFAAKERPADHPLIVHIADVGQLSDWAQTTPASAEKLAAAFWPGPLTMILPKQPDVSDLLTASQPTVGLRMPAHPVAQTLLRAFGSGVAAPSANKFTHISPTTAAAVAEELGDVVDLILDGGDCAVGLESTIVDLTGEQVMVLRPGMISQAALEEVLGERVLQRCSDVSPTTRAPGMHHVHYAPNTPARLVRTSELLAQLAMLTQPVGVLAYSLFDFPSAVRIVQLSNDPKQYAHDLYHALRQLDHEQLSSIVIESVPNAPEWDAIRDRLQKACGQRGELT